MRAMVLEQVGQPLILKEVPCPIPGAFEILIKIQTCGVCRLDKPSFSLSLRNRVLPLEIFGFEIFMRGFS